MACREYLYLEIMLKARVNQGFSTQGITPLGVGATMCIPRGRKPD